MKIVFDNEDLDSQFLRALSYAAPPTSSIIASNLIKSLVERASYGRSQKNLPSSPISTLQSTIKWLKVTK